MPDELRPPPPDARPAKPEGVVAAEGFELNEVGRRMWQLCDGRHTLRQIAQALTDEFAADPREAAMDAAAFVAQLVAMKLLVV